MKLYSRKNKLSNNLTNSTKGKYVIHKYTNAIFKVVDTNLLDEDLRLKIVLIDNPCKYKLMATGGVVFSLYKEGIKGFWIEKYSSLKIFKDEDSDAFYWNVLVEDLYLID